MNQSQPSLLMRLPVINDAASAHIIAVKHEHDNRVEKLYGVVLNESSQNYYQLTEGSLGEIHSRLDKCSPETLDLLFDEYFIKRRSGLSTVMDYTLYETDEFVRKTAVYRTKDEPTSQNNFAHLFQFPILDKVDSHFANSDPIRLSDDRRAEINIVLNLVHAMFKISLAKWEEARRQGSRASGPKPRISTELAEFVIEHPDSVDAVATYVDERVSALKKIDYGHLEEYLKNGSSALGSGVL